MQPPRDNDDFNGPPRPRRNGPPGGNFGGPPRRNGSGRPFGSPQDRNFDGPMGPPPRGYGYSEEGPPRGPRREGPGPAGERPAPKDFIFGLRAVEEALEASRGIDKVWIDRDAGGPVLLGLRKRLKDMGVPVQPVPLPKLETVARGKNHQGVVAFVSQVPYQPLEEILARLFEQGQVPLLVLLDGVTDVRNLGAIARTAECMGAHALLLPEQGSARLNADAVKTSAGALHHLPVCRVRTIKAALALLAASGVRTLGLTEKATDPLPTSDLGGPLCLVLGDEGFGLSPEALKGCQALAFVPMRGRIGSLNVSVAAGMALYEAERQRQDEPGAGA